MPSIQHSSRFDQKKFDFILGKGFVLDALWNHIHFALRHINMTIPEIDAQSPFQNDKRLIGIVMVMPDKIALKFYQLELVTIHFSDDLG